MKIAIVGLGYVGLSLACLLARQNTVFGLDILPQKVEAVNQGRSPFRDNQIEAFLKDHKGLITATLDPQVALSSADYAIIATPTNSENPSGWLNIDSIETSVERVSIFAPNACVVIKSTVPIGFTERLAKRYPDISLLFSPEFLREGQALYDNLHPSRIVVGYPQAQRGLAKAPSSCERIRSDLEEKAERFAQLLAQAANEKAPGIPQLICTSTEAEAIKLFANTYLAMRVAYINELDTFAEIEGLDSAKIIEGIGLDPRIGTHYNNPSFGYGGYCLPKDSRQLLANYRGIPQKLISAIVESNQMRIAHIAEQITQRDPAVIGLYRLVMKNGSDNFQQSASIIILDQLIKSDREVIIYEPLLDDCAWENCAIISDLEEFKQRSDLIVCNRVDAELSDVSDKVYTRDVWHVG